MRLSDEELEQERRAENAGAQTLLAAAAHLLTKSEALQGRPLPESDPAEIGERALNLRALAVITLALDSMAEGLRSHETELTQQHERDRERAQQERQRGEDDIRRAREHAREHVTSDDPWPDPETIKDQEQRAFVERNIELRQHRREVTEEQPGDVKRGVDARDALREAILAMNEKRGVFFKIRKRNEEARRRARWLHVLLIVGFGLVIGVIAVGVIEQELEPFGKVVTWAFAIAAWAFVGYLLEPRWHQWLLRRRLTALRDEVIAGNVAWAQARADLHASGADDALPRYREALPFEELGSVAEMLGLPRVEPGQPTPPRQEHGGSDG